MRVGEFVVKCDCVQCDGLMHCHRFEEGSARAEHHIHIDESLYIIDVMVRHEHGVDIAIEIKHSHRVPLSKMEALASINMHVIELHAKEVIEFFLDGESEERSPVRNISSNMCETCTEAENKALNVQEQKMLKQLSSACAADSI